MNDNDTPGFEYPPLNTIVLGWDAKAGKDVRCKRINHPALGFVFVEVDGPNWNRVLPEIRAWKDIEK